MTYNFIEISPKAHYVNNAGFLGHNVSILCACDMTIGEGTIIAPGVVITDSDHNLSDPDNLEGMGVMKPVVIGNKCWIGANAVILKGVTLGDNCVVGAGAVVTHSFPAYSVVVGNPAHLLRMRK